LKKENDLNLENGKRPQENKTTKDKQKLKTIVFLKLEDDLNFFEKGRCPYFFWKMEDNLRK
jgi:hypothetical protein